MKKKFLMGNEAMAFAALSAGVNLVCGYPGTPSSEVLETVAKNRTEHTYVEWSVNEKAALEVGAGAALAGARVLVTMKQVGLNVASDPLMSLAYIGVKGGMVVLVADDPGPISSQTEQDTRTFAAYAKLPVFDPSSGEEAYHLLRQAFALSEELHTPVLFRPTTRVCHGYSDILVAEPEEYEVHEPDGFEKDSSRWVIFPALSRKNHALIEQRNRALMDRFSEGFFNRIVAGTGKKGIVSSGISASYVMEEAPEGTPLLFVTTPFPFPEKLALSFLTGLDEVLVAEELDPVLEKALLETAGRHGLSVKIKGKLTGDGVLSGENTRDVVKHMIVQFLSLPEKEEEAENTPKLPVRPPVLCAGCPHRASFYAVKTAMKGIKTAFCGDIGCYTLGNAKPLDMVDTCLCMGAGLGMAQGINRMEPDRVCFAFVGDSTFFASAICGVVNAIYNKANMTLIVLDNATTAMTGHQPHPGTGRTMMGEVARAIDIEAVLKGIGVEQVRTVDPLDQKQAVETVKELAFLPGVKAIIFRSPCIALFKPGRGMKVGKACISCKKCLREIGCPALYIDHEVVKIDTSLCNGCGLCQTVCPVGAICTDEEGK